ncbi:MAG: hypothetical protein ACPGSD_14150 [Flavobacteriales bacterium]
MKEILMILLAIFSLQIRAQVHTEHVIFDKVIRSNMEVYPLDSTENKIESISLRLTQIPFDSVNHKLLRNSNNLVTLIDNYPVYGTDGDVPFTMLSKAELSLNGKLITLNVQGMYNPDLKKISTHLNSQFNISKVYNGYVIRGVFPGGGMGYAFEWLIVNGRAFRTILTKDLEIMDLDFLHKGK